MSLADASNDSSFQEVNRLFALSFENTNGRTWHSGYYLPKVEIKENNVKIDGKFFWSASNKVDKITYENIRKIATGKGDDYTTSLWVLCIIN